MNADLLKQLLDICRFRAGPEDLPASRALVLVTAVASVISNTLIDNFHRAMSAVLAMSIAQVALFGGVIWLVLMLRGFPERWDQTISALYGTGALLQLAGWAVVSAAMLLTGAEPGQVLPAMLLTGLGIWFLAIMTWVLRRAMEISTGIALLASIGCQLLIGLVLFQFFPPDVATS